MKQRMQNVLHINRNKDPIAKPAYVMKKKSRMQHGIPEEKWHQTVAEDMLVCGRCEDNDSDRLKLGYRCNHATPWAKK